MSPELLSGSQVAQVPSSLDVIPSTPLENGVPLAVSPVKRASSPFRLVVPMSPSSILKKRKSADSEDDGSMSRTPKRFVVFDDAANTRHEWTTEHPDDFTQDPFGFATWIKPPSSPRSALRTSPSRSAPLAAFSPGNRPKLQRQPSFSAPSTAVVPASPLSAVRPQPSPARGLLAAFAAAEAEATAPGPAGAVEGPKAAPSVVAVFPPPRSSAAEEETAVSDCLFPALVDSVDPMTEILSSLGGSNGLHSYLKARQVSLLTFLM
jgi:hypothetical protein